MALYEAIAGLHRPGQGSMEESNRQLAEMHYKIALAYEYEGMFDETKVHLEKSIGVLKQKINELSLLIGDKGKVSPINFLINKKGKASVKAPESLIMNDTQKEITEINSLLPEVSSTLTFF